MILSQQHLELEGRAVISHFTFQPPLIAAADLENSACFIFPVQSQGKLYRADGKTEVGEHEGVLMKCGTYVNKWYGVEADEVAEVVILRLHPEIISNILDARIKSSLDTTTMVNSPTNAVVGLNFMLEKYLESLFFYLKNPGLATEELIKLKIKELTLLLINSEQANPVKELLATLFQRDRYSLRSIVEANLYEDLGLQEIASIANVSSSTFKRRFKAEFGTTFNKYVMRKRLSKGRELLKQDSTTPVSEIAYACGYNDPGYFTKSFHKIYGLSPTAYRQENKAST